MAFCAICGRDHDTSAHCNTATTGDSRPKRGRRKRASQQRANELAKKTDRVMIVAGIVILAIVAFFLLS
jgi:uncharacterized membrane protein YvbJ